MNKTIYLTTTIPYVNSRPHVGFALELVQADAIARRYREAGWTVRFQTGTDENAFKNVIAARDRGVAVQTLVDENAARFRALAVALNISFDEFVRTTDPRHRTAVHRFWQGLRPGDIYKKHYPGFYCTGCEDFLLERDLVDGLCPDHDTRPTVVAEENYFFRLSAYQAQLDELIASGRLCIRPDSRRNEVLAFIRRGLEDISVSRVAGRTQGWGIPVPDDDTQVIYVWIDALINYLTGLGYGRTEAWADTWNSATKKVHVVGKNVWKFHAVYWPALLFSAGLVPPDTVLVHGFLTENGRKISKSLGNTIDPLEIIATYGAEALRYHLLRAISPFEDCDFSQDRLRSVYNTELANELGNLLGRVTSLCGKIGHARGPSIEGSAGRQGAEGGLTFDETLSGARNIVIALNREIERTEPWRLIKAGEKEALRPHLDSWLTTLEHVAQTLSPVIPLASQRILAAVNANPITQAPALFPRVGP